MNNEWNLERERIFKIKWNKQWMNIQHLMKKREQIESWTVNESLRMNESRTVNESCTVNQIWRESESWRVNKIWAGNERCTLN